jgi:hypothetical protein
MTRPAIRASVPVVAVLLSGGTYLAHAALGGANGVTIPYAGRLELNGQGVNGTVGLVVDVFNAPTGGSPCFTTPTILAPVSAGAFAVVVGGVPEVCVRGRDVFLGVKVDQGAGPVTLGGRQRVHPAVAALTSGSGDLAVAGNAEVGGNVAASGNVVATGAVVAASRAVHLGAVANEQGAYVAWNRSGNGGETNLVNHRGLGSGGFHFDDTANGSAMTRLMTLSPSGHTLNGDVTINGTIRGATAGFGGLFSVTTALGNPGTACPNGVGLVFTATNNVFTGSQSCPSGYTQQLVSRADFCQANVGTQRLDTYYCWK